MENENLVEKTITYLMASVALLQTEIVVLKGALHYLLENDRGKEYADSLRNEMKRSVQERLSDFVERLPPVSEKIQEEILLQVAQLLKGGQGS